MSLQTRIPHPVNEPVLSYAPGSPEREAVKAKLAEMASMEVDIPLIINGKEVRTGNTHDIVMPHNHGHVLGRYHLAGPDEIEAALEACRGAWNEWSRMPWGERAAIFLKAADLAAGPWRAALNASTMLCQSKTVHQAEIDAACEFADFCRFNAHFAQEIYSQQPESSPEVWNCLEYRPLEGFIYAVSPFNFTSIGGNLAGAPALMGNVSIWKPSHSAVYSNWVLMQIFLEAGVPAGVINFLPGNAAQMSEQLLAQPDLAGIHFTGSSDVFRGLWQQTSENLPRYRNYPRLVGETGGKDFIVAHPSANPDALVTAIIRGSFEYQGQKCSASSRAYIPESLWKVIREPLIEKTEGLAMGDPADFRNFVAAVIHRSAYDKLKRYIDEARESEDADVIAGGQCDDSTGYYIRPTLIQAYDPKYITMCEELFGPIMTIYVYPDDQWNETLELVDTTSPYALTGAVFSQDRTVLVKAMDTLRHSAGNFYLNDKPTGAVVGQQPFGGARASGTNDKAGSGLNLLRWVTPRTLKENFNPPVDYTYPFMAEE
jgi:1-pyrroline-5-carboxylate dehydrogenase